MMALVGADVGAIRTFVLGLSRRSKEIHATTERLTTVIDNIPWVGSDREQFVREWNASHRPALVALCGDLMDAARTATRHADAQEAASAASGSGGGSW